MYTFLKRLLERNFDTYLNNIGPRKKFLFLTSILLALISTYLTLHRHRDSTKAPGIALLATVVARNENCT